MDIANRKIKRKGINILTDLPIPFTTPNPTIKQVSNKNKECQKINISGDEDKLPK